MTVRCALVVSVLFAACPAPEPVPDAAIEIDAGIVTPDAGRPPRDAGMPDAGFTDVPPSKWCEAHAFAVCSRHQRCGRLSDAGFDGCMLTERHVATCDQAAIISGVDVFRLHYVEEEALRCLNDHASGSCEDAPAACARVFIGLSPPDFPCMQENECDVSGFCDLFDNQCPHQCRGWVPRGALCDGARNRCAPDDACETNDAGLRSCIPKPRQGDACSDFNGCGVGALCSNGICAQVNGELNQPCGVINGYPLCPAEYFCSTRDGGTGSCQRRAGLGGGCTGPASCLPSLRCTATITTGVCLTKATLGERCIDYADCEDGLYCRNDVQRCEPLPTAGGSCAYEATAYRCAPGHSCAYSGTSDDICVAWKSNGERCSYSGECLSNDCEYATLPDGGFGGTCVAICSQRADGGQ